MTVVTQLASSGGALSGVRVLDMSDSIGAYATKLLADLGADVTKIESPAGDAARRTQPLRGGSADLSSSFWLYMHSNKRSAALDLDVEHDRDILKRLIGDADVVVESFVPGHLRRLGLDFEELHRHNPRLVMTSITPFGQTGPRSQWAASDLVSWAASGVMSTVGDPDRPPVPPGGDIAFVIAGLYAAAGTLVALLARSDLGHGQHVDISVEEALLSISCESGLPQTLDDGHLRTRIGNQRSNQAPVGHFQAMDGAVTFVVSLPDQWHAFVSWVIEELGDHSVSNPKYEGGSLGRAKYKDEVNGYVSRLCQRHTRKELFIEGQRRGIPVTPVNSPGDVAYDPHLESRKYWQQLEDDTMGVVNYPGPPYRLSRSPWRLRSKAPHLGQRQVDQRSEPVVEDD